MFVHDGCEAWTVSRPEHQSIPDWLRPPAAGNGLSDFWAVYEPQYDEISAATLALLQGERDLVEVIRTQSNQQPRDDLRRDLAEAIRTSQWAAYAAALNSVGAHYAAGGLEFRVWSLAIRAFRSVMRERLLAAYCDSAPRVAGSIGAMDDLVDMMLAIITDEYIRQREATIREQQTIRELSTPVLRVNSGVLVAPVVGVFDSVRAEQLTRELLAAISNQRVSAIVLDVTGLSAIDEIVAAHILSMVAACRVMGAATVLSGVSPATARMLGHVGVEMSGLITANDLRDGIARANAVVASRIF